jgi:cysteinyl-tRNA synthetase
MNITDVGHLTSDSDTGEDKMEKHASTVADVLAVADKYTQEFLQNLHDLNILQPSVIPKASDHVPEQIEMITTLIEKGFAYESAEAVYFDISKYPDYTKLIGQKLTDMKLGARQEVVADASKKNPHDFVLWFKAVGRYEKHIMRWPSPWGEGFPGWHIECSAMAKKYLGNTFDIHIGGVDLKFPHHTNEIAQSFGANHASLAKYWMHGEHLLVGEGRMGKSEGNFITLQTLIDKKFNPLALRYLTLTTHYRSKLNFSWDSLTASQNALNNLNSEISSFESVETIAPKFEEAFLTALNDDLNMPQAIACVWDLIKSDEISEGSKLATIFKFDEVLGLNLKKTWEEARQIPVQVKNLMTEREQARQSKDFAKSDELRQRIEESGFILEDTVDGVKLKKKF